MSAPSSRLTTELDHTLGASMLGDAMLQYRPTSHTELRIFLDELLTHARATANVLSCLTEHRATTIDEGGDRDLVDAWDVFGLTDLLAGLLEVITIVERRDYDASDSPEVEPPSTTERLWLPGGHGPGQWVDAKVWDGLSSNGGAHHG